MYLILFLNVLFTESGCKDTDFKQDGKIIPCFFSKNLFSVPAILSELKIIVTRPVYFVDYFK